MQGCFAAIQKKYLRTVVLSIYTDPDNPQRVTEVYQFKIKYSSKGPQLEFESGNNKVASMASGSTKKSSILLVRKLYTLMQNLGPLPDNVCLNMKLSYYDDVTPQDYQPPGFKEGDSGVMEFEKEPVKLCMGEVVTPFHTLRVDITTERDRLEQVEEEPMRARDKWMLPTDEQSATAEQSLMREAEEKPDKDPSYMDNAEVQKLTCQEQMEVCDDVTKNSQTDTRVEVVESTSQMEVVALMKTRSGRVVSSSVEKKSANKITKKPSLIPDKMVNISPYMVTRFELPNSQEFPPTSASKKRKFSEPKERY